MSMETHWRWRSRQMIFSEVVEFHVIYSFPDPTLLREVCQPETFIAKCDDQSVIVMETAFYGRMKEGRCLTDEFGNLGCKHDVIKEMDAFCSGKRSCEVKVDDSSFPSAICHKQLKSYLLAIETVDESCDQREIHVSTGSAEGFISSLVAEESSCGKNDLRPWIITVDKGQQINVTLYDFSPNASLAPDHFPQVCKVYATIRETEDSRSSATTVCGYMGRITPMYLSATNQIQIRLMSSASGNKPKYLLRYNTVGCATPVQYAGMRVDRTADMAVVKCLGSDSTWRMTCDKGKWVGNAPVNCTKEGLALATQHMDQDLSAVPYALSISIIVAIALIVSCLIFVIGVVCIRRRIQRHAPNAACEHPSAIPDYYDVPPLKEQKMMGTPSNGRENEYATMRLLRAACFNRDGTRRPSQQDCCTIAYDTRGIAPSEHTYESPELIRRMDSAMEGSTTSPHYFDLSTANGHVTPQYFDIDLPTTFQLHSSIEAGRPDTCVAPAHSSFVAAHRQSNKYSL
ncbi:hypothetical protein CAPTEDRAFT_220546 [Capitella teleta]|uniref:SUEL-type lectin domain-containing protein n=1 Tax=Capitella teleta TaxID=283909 RepID=R7UAE4_CAPTE|nr:hypothetical protein CAPTEDRAFT_220546 [Capitella teleta]|eukprot:ELU00788.1 hypothetical protein CAPTEDRAFT_220546 [Capitella teleta]